MKTVNVHEAKTTLSALLAQVEAGEEIVIARNGEPVARLTRYPISQQREKGGWRRLPEWQNFSYDPAVFAPLTDEETSDEGWV